MVYSLRESRLSRLLVPALDTLAGAMDVAVGPAPLRLDCLQRKPQ